MYAIWPPVYPAKLSQVPIWPQESCNISSARYRNTTTPGESLFSFFLLFLSSFFYVEVKSAIEKRILKTHACRNKLQHILKLQKCKHNLEFESGWFLTGSVIWIWLKILSLIFQDRLMMAAGPSGLAWQGLLLSPPASPLLLRPLKCAPANSRWRPAEGPGRDRWPHLCLSGASPNNCSPAGRRAGGRKDKSKGRKSKDPWWRRGS